MWPHRWQPTRLPRAWDSPRKNTGVGCHFLLQCMKVKRESEVAQSCPTLSDPMDCSPPGYSIHGIFQARVLEWGAIAFSAAYHWFAVKMDFQISQWKYDLERQIHSPRDNMFKSNPSGLLKLMVDFEHWREEKLRSHWPLVDRSVGLEHHLGCSFGWEPIPGTPSPPD